MNDLLKDNIKIHNSSFNLEFDGFIKELKYYIENSFGSAIRLDYGTGHELSFLAFIGGLIDFKLLSLEELTGSDILTIFAKYYDLTRRLILVYSLEPAGSHGVWGLDDHYHLIYILVQHNSMGTKTRSYLQYNRSLRGRFLTDTKKQTYM